MREAARCRALFVDLSKPHTDLWMLSRMGQKPSEVCKQERDKPGLVKGSFGLPCGLGAFVGEGWEQGGQEARGGRSDRAVAGSCEKGQTLPGPGTGSAVGWTWGGRGLGLGKKSGLPWLRSLSSSAAETAFPPFPTSLSGAAPVRLLWAGSP